MAETFTNARLVMGQTLRTIYTPPSGVHTAIVLMCQIANVAEGEDEEGEGKDIRVDVLWMNPGDPDEYTHLVKRLMLPTTSSLAAIEGKMVLLPGQELQGRCSKNDGAEMTLVVLEMHE